MNQEAVQHLERATANLARAQETEKSARKDLAESIVEAARKGMRQVEIVRVTGYTREHVRRICRRAGLVPDA